MCDQVFNPGDMAIAHNYLESTYGYDNVWVKKGKKRKPCVANLRNGTRVKILDHVKIDERQDEVFDKDTGMPAQGQHRLMLGEKYKVEFTQYKGYPEVGYPEVGYIMRGHVQSLTATEHSQANHEPQGHGDAVQMQVHQSNAPPGCMTVKLEHAMEPHDDAQGSWNCVPTGSCMAVKPEPVMEPQDDAQEWLSCGKCWNYPPRSSEQMYKITKSFGFMPPEEFPDPEYPICSECLLMLLRAHPGVTLQFNGCSGQDEKYGMVVTNWW